MEDTVVIDTKLGKLRGKAMKSILTNEMYYSFRGIPYGKPPIGQLRFMAPQPFGGWEGVRDALKDGQDPKQRVIFRLPGMDPNKETDGDEDCLFLCVYSKELPSKACRKKPVMVHIHGGGFIGGSGSSKGANPDYFMGSDVVLVSFNYRCGAFGFLSLENEEVPGNAGLKDQTLVLKWVQDNIESFGGDPDNVTIFGISAGGASVHYHLLSPLSKGLFHRAIVQSGFSNNSWAFQPSPKKVALQLAKKLGCKSEDPHKVLEFLRSVPSDDIVVATKTFVNDEEHLMQLGLVICPCVEVKGSEKFLPDTPRNLMKRGEYNKVPTILGLCENEGSIYPLFTMMDKLSFETIPNAINDNPEILVPLGFGPKMGSTEHKMVAEAIKEFFFKGKKITLKDFDDLLKYVGDLTFNIGFGETRKYLVNSSHPVYTYLFTNHTSCICRPLKTMMGSGIPAPESKDAGTCHGADALFLFRPNFGVPLPEPTGDFKEAILKHVKIWTTFASTGNPNVKESELRWDQDSQSRPCFMDIGTEWVMREGVPLEERVDFWQQLAEKYCKD